MVVAVIADIVGSRRLGDRARAQRMLDEGIARAQTDLPLAIQPLTPTVGDEQQAVYETLADALTGLLMVQLILPDGLRCRFGLGIGDIGAIPAAGGEIPEGPGWWAARSAIERVHDRERAVPHARTGIAADPGEDAGVHAAVDSANAYLLVRDHVVGVMSERERRLTYGRLIGRTQTELAASEEISQSAVSQALRGSGAAALLAGLDLLDSSAPEGDRT